MTGLGLGSDALGAASRSLPSLSIPDEDESLMSDRVMGIALQKQLQSKIKLKKIKLPKLKQNKELNKLVKHL